jgi:hypothetical protein
MARRHTVPIPPVFDDDIRIATANKREIVGFSAYNKERQLFLKLAFRTGDIATVWIDPACAHYLFEHLKRILPDSGETGGSPVNWGVSEVSVTYGEMPWGADAKPSRR